MAIRFLRLPAAALCLAAVACTNIGPGTVARDRFEYSAALGNSWKEQNLLNIVKLRYADPPIFLDVGQIVSGYTMETQGTAASGFTTNGIVLGQPVNLSTNAHFTDHPTITYTPLTGQNFIRGLMTPIPPNAILGMIQSGWRSDLVFSLAIDSINGLRNRSAGAGRLRAGDPDFSRLIQILHRIQDSGAVGMRLVGDPRKGDEFVMLFFRQQGADPDIVKDIDDAKKILNLKPDTTEFKIVYGAPSGTGNEIALITRSMLHIMLELADNIDVPEADTRENRVLPTLPREPGSPPPLLHIHSGNIAPADAFAAVHYRGHAFWIDDTDIRSKATFSFLMLMFTLADTSPPAALPTVTIPTN